MGDFDLERAFAVVREALARLEDEGAINMDIVPVLFEEIVARMHADKLTIEDYLDFARAHWEQWRRDEAPRETSSLS